eukprot:4113517-Pleurochrysis_carterae.AAC.1
MNEADEIPLSILLPALWNSILSLGTQQGIVNKVKPQTIVQMIKIMYEFATARGGRIAYCTTTPTSCAWGKAANGRDMGTWLG